MSHSHPPRNPYAVLGLSPDASPGAVRRAYLRRAKAAHPDAVGGDAAEFREVQDAYERARALARRNGAERATGSLRWGIHFSIRIGRIDSRI